VLADLEQVLPLLESLASELFPEGLERRQLLEQVRNARTRLWERTEARGRRDDFPMAPERILEDLRRELPNDAVLVTDVGWNKNGVAQCYRLPARGDFLTPGGFSTMGFGPAAALGAKVAQPRRPVIALIGDGAMSSQFPAIPTAVEQGLTVVWLVMNNAAFGTIADLQANHYGSGYGCEFRTPDGRPYSPDFAALARACGADGRRVGAASELRPALRDALTSGRPYLLDVPMVNEPVPTPGHWNINDIYQGRF
jgi:acetolactate synthase-1/2/3 large subunit